MLDNHESLPFRRRGYERDGMLQTLIEHASFKALLQAAQASSTAKELPKVPTEIQHFDLESFHDRPVQTTLVELLLLPKQDERFTSCVVMHGMGGTGKTVTAVAVVQEKAVRAHFSHIYWLTVGADAVEGKIRQLQSALHKQVTSDGQGHDERRGTAEGRAGVAWDAGGGNADGTSAGGARRSVATGAGSFPQPGGQCADGAPAAGHNTHSRSSALAGYVHRAVDDGEG
jgi:hypothetical protein